MKRGVLESIGKGALLGIGGLAVLLFAKKGISMVTHKFSAYGRCEGCGLDDDLHPSGFCRSCLEEMAEQGIHYCPCGAVLTEPGEWLCKSCETDYNKYLDEGDVQVMGSPSMDTLKKNAKTFKGMKKKDYEELLMAAQNVETPPGWDAQWEKNVQPKIEKGTLVAEVGVGVATGGALWTLLRKTQMENLDKLSAKQYDKVLDFVADFIGKFVTVLGILKTNDYDVDTTVKEIKGTPKSKQDDLLVEFDVDWGEVNWLMVALAGAGIADDIGAVIALAGPQASIGWTAAIGAILTDIVAIVILANQFDDAIKVKGEKGKSKAEREKDVAKVKKGTDDIKTVTREVEKYKTDDIAEVKAFIKRKGKLTDDDMEYLMKRHNLDADHLGALMTER